MSEGYFVEIVNGLAVAGHETFHVVLDAPEDVLRRRIERAEEAQAWRLQHLPIYVDARDWMVARADLVVDTSTLGPASVAARFWTRWATEAS